MRINARRRSNAGSNLKKKQGNPTKVTMCAYRSQSHKERKESNQLFGSASSFKAIQASIMYERKKGNLGCRQDPRDDWCSSQRKKESFTSSIGC
jgi:hypothetical protein